MEQKSRLISVFTGRQDEIVDFNLSQSDSFMVKPFSNEQSHEKTCLRGL